MPTIQFQKRGLLALRESGTIGKAAAEVIVRQREKLKELQGRLNASERQVRDQALLIEKLHRQIAALR